MAKQTKEKTEMEFTKQELLTAKKLAKNKDLVNALLEDDKTYTVEKVEQIVDNYLKGKVK